MAALAARMAAISASSRPDGGHARVVVRAFGAQALGDVGRERHVHARHRIRVVVVVDQGRVFVRAGHFVDAEAPLAVPAAEAEPDARRVQHDLGAVLRHEVEVAGRQQVQADRIGDVGIDVVLGGAGRVVGRALLAGDGAPGVERALLMRHLARPLARLGQAVVAVLQQRARDLRAREQEEGEDVDLGVPEIVAFVALPRHALGGDIRPAVAPDRLQQVELVEAHALLQGVVAVDADVGLVPEAGQPVGLLGHQGIEAGLARGPQFGLRMQADRAFRHVARGGVGDVLAQHNGPPCCGLDLEGMAAGQTLDLARRLPGSNRWRWPAGSRCCGCAAAAARPGADFEAGRQQAGARDRRTDARIVAGLQVRDLGVDVRHDADHGPRNSAA
jgi:hypothetical protein